MGGMDTQQINYIIEKAIIGLHSGEIEALFEFTIPTPMQMAKKTGMPTTMTAQEALEGLNRTMAVLVRGTGKLTSAERTPNTKEVQAVLKELIFNTKYMEPKDRKLVLERLRDYLGAARDHANRLAQAAYKSNDIGFGDVGPIRAVRDMLEQARALIIKQRGGGLSRKPRTKTKKTKTVTGPSAWVKQDIEITMGDRTKKKVEAFVRGVWAVHQSSGLRLGAWVPKSGMSDPDSYTITHTPTGMAAASGLRGLEKTKDRVDKMLTANPDLAMIAAKTEIQKRGKDIVPFLRAA